MRRFEPSRHVHSKQQPASLPELSAAIILAAEHHAGKEREGGNKKVPTFLTELATLSLTSALALLNLPCICAERGAATSFLGLRRPARGWQTTEHGASPLPAAMWDPAASLPCSLAGHLPGKVISLMSHESCRLEFSIPFPLFSDISVTICRKRHKHPST